MAAPAVPESSVPEGALLRLGQEGIGGTLRLRRLVARGDWKARTLAASALGCIIRDDPTAFRPDVFRHRIARHVAWLGRRFPTTGPRGEHVRNEVVNALADATWVVRTAAALALGECCDSRLVPYLTPLLKDVFRPVRLAAAAALSASGVPTDAALDGAEAAPGFLGDTESSLEWLTRLAAAHRGVLELLPGSIPGRPAGAKAWGAFLAGEAAGAPQDTRDAEMLRYAQGKDTHYNFTKPFHPGHRDQNIALIHSFLAVAENLRVPQGGRILDMGGGAAWVSELLAKIGYTPVTLDLSTALLRVGRDRFRRENLAPRFTAADMTALPFAPGTFDAVVIVDALHHVPEVAAVFREVFRVLVEGGQFLIAEAGEGHSENEKSRAEMLVHGVAEREIHVAEVTRYARSAGFTDVRVVPHFVTQLTLRPEDLEAAAGSPSSEWRVWDDDKPVTFDAHVLQSMLRHPVMVFRKGERALDSRMPRVLKGLVDPRLTRQGRSVQGLVALANEGDTLWLRGGDEPGRVRLGFQLMTPERRLVNLDFARSELPSDVPPGGRLEVPVDLTLPSDAEPYVLKIDLVDEHVCWFEDRGSRPVYLAV